MLALVSRHRIRPCLRILGLSSVSVSMVETCINICALSLSLVMSGTGDVQVLKVLRKLNKRDGVSYGSYMAVSMAIGFLFLGIAGCPFTL